MNENSFNLIILIYLSYHHGRLNSQSHVGEWEEERRLGEFVIFDFFLTGVDLTREFLGAGDACAKQNE